MIAAPPFWSAAILYLVVSGPAIEIFTSALGYSGAAVALRILRFVGVARISPRNPVRKRARNACLDTKNRP